MAGLLGGGDDELSSGGTGTDHADPLAGDVEITRPSVGVHEGAAEAVAPGTVGDVALREEPERRCPTCGNVLKLYVQVCPRCGTDLYLPDPSEVRPGPGA